MLNWKGLPENIKIVKANYPPLMTDINGHLVVNAKSMNDYLINIHKLPGKETPLQALLGKNMMQKVITNPSRLLTENRISHLLTSIFDKDSGVTIYQVPLPKNYVRIKGIMVDMSGYVISCDPYLIPPRINNLQYIKNEVSMD